MTTTLAQGIAHRFRFQTNFLGILTEGFSTADWHHVGGGEFRNSPHWILAHLVMSRRFLLRMVGVVVEKEPWEAQFAPGSELGDPSEYPPIDELTSAFRSLGEELVTKLGALSSEELAKPLERKFPDGGADVLGGASFMCFHEGYHLGQLGAIRRMVGKPGFA